MPNFAFCRCALFGMAALALPAHAAEPLALDQLQAITAGEEHQTTVTTRQTVDAFSGNNEITAGTVTSGDVGFSSGAFSGFNGIGNVVVNTGNNNAIQGTLSVTLVGVP